MRSLAIFILTFMMIVLIGVIGTIYWYEYDVNKCDSLKGNDYYYTKNNCYTTYNAPIYVFISMFLYITTLPWAVWITSLIGYKTKK